MHHVIDVDGPKLESLPPDIKRRIVRTGSESANEMRLISSSWNKLVMQFFAEPAVLERVYFNAGIPLDPMYRSIADEQIREQNKEAMTRLHMYAIIPEWCGSRVGVGRWLKVFEKHDEGAIEVLCEPQTVISTEEEPWCAAFTALIFLVFALLLGVYLVLIPTAVIIVLYALYRRYDFREKEGKPRSRLVRFVLSFTKLHTLVVGDLSTVSHKKIYNQITRILGKAQIELLEYRAKVFFEEARDNILKLCRNHGIRHVHVTTGMGTSTNFREFILELSEMDVTLDLYSTDDSVINIFGQTRAFWNDMMADLRSQNMTMKMSTVSEPSWNAALAPPNSFSRIQLLNSDLESSIQQSRGFIHK